MDAFLHDFRSVGYSVSAFRHPFNSDHKILFSAWLHIPEKDLPDAMCFHPNQWVRDAWDRVAHYIRHTQDPTALGAVSAYRGTAPTTTCFPLAPGWERVANTRPLLF